jgi:hypothetical protein
MYSTVYSGLKKKYGLRSVRRKTPLIQSKPITNNNIIPKLLKYWENSKHYGWGNQPNYNGTGLHYSSTNNMKKDAQICGNLNMVDYNDTMSFDQEVESGLLDDFNEFPLVRCKITCLNTKYDINSYILLFSQLVQAVSSLSKIL